MNWINALCEVLLYVILIGLFLRALKRKENPDGEFSKDTAQCLKGLCCVVIFGHHYGQLSGEPILALFTHFGYLVLNLFLMISGYGVAYGLKNNPDYLKNFLIRRCGRVILCYWGMNAITVLINFILYGQSNLNNIGRIIACLLGIDIYCPTSWYFVMLFWLYISFYIVARLGQKYLQIGMSIAVSAIILGCIIINVPLWCYNYLYAFNVGIYMAYREKTKVKKETSSKIFWSIAAFCILFVISKMDRVWHVSAPVQVLLSISAVFSSMGLTMAFMYILNGIRVESKLLYKLGNISTGIYIFHTCIILNPLLQSYITEHTKSWGISLWISLALTIAVSVAVKGVMNLGKNFLSRKPWK